MNLMRRISLVFSLLLMYSYVIYPAVLLVLSRVYRKFWRQKDFEPHVTVVISAYNEEGVIGEKVLNTLGLDYPENKLKVVVASDGSTDATAQLVSSMRDRRVKLVHFPQRIGKTACLNRIVPRAKGEIVVFTDANSILPRGVIRRIVRNFADPGVGLVTGWTRYRGPTGDEAPAGSYSRFEKALKLMESASGSCVGADGAIFAIRKSLFRPLRDDDINDFVIPLDIVRQKQRAVLDPEVFCIEDAAEAAGDEYRRQVRITTRTLHAIRRNRDMLNPLRYGLFSFFLVSHKVLRFLCPYFFVGAYAVNLALVGRTGLLPKAVLAFQNLFLAGALSGGAGRTEHPVVRLCRMLFITLAAQGVAWVRMLAGYSDTTWLPARQDRAPRIEPLPKREAANVQARTVPGGVYRPRAAHSPEVSEQSG